MSDDVPLSKSKRAKTAGLTMTKVAGKKLKLACKRPFMSKQKFENAQSQSDKEIASTIFEAASSLRGAALKILQFLSLEVDVLPDAYRKEFAKTHYKVPPLSRVIVRKTLQDAFGKLPDELFKAFDEVPFAAASLGQVHKATTIVKGQEVAVKIKYPGIAKAVENDIRLAKQVILPFFKDTFIGSAIAEVEQRLEEELDYEKEFQTTQWFHDNIGGFGVALPRPIKEFSSQEVLTTTLQKGMHLAEWLAMNPRQAERNVAAQAMYDFFMRLLFKHGRIHADPNPGNYLLHADGRVGLVDFGCVKTFDPAFTETIRQIFNAHIQNDDLRAREHYRLLGIDVDHEIYEKYVIPFGEWIALPFQSRAFDFGANKDYCSQGVRIFRELLQQKAFGKFNVNVLFMNRNFYGLYRIFEMMKAQVVMTNEWIQPQTK
ncbi:MAG: ABC1 kinase family protein [Oligoflexales bacterium]